MSVRFVFNWIIVMIVAVVASDIDARQRSTCTVKVKNMDHICRIITLNQDCEGGNIPKYLRILPQTNRKRYPPVVRNVTIDDHNTTTVNIYWSYRSSKRKYFVLNGFLVQVKTYTNNYLTATRHFIAEYDTEVKHQQRYHRFKLSNIGLTGTSSNSTVLVTIWSLISIRKKHSPPNIQTIHPNICQQYTEVYKELGKSAKSSSPKIIQQNIIKRNVLQHEDISEPCSCWKNEDLIVNTNISTAITVTSWNLCPERYPYIYPTKKYLSNSTSTIDSKDCEMEKCCIEFSGLSAGIYQLKVLYICDVDGTEDPPTCSKERQLNISRNSPDIESAGKKIDALTFALAAVAVTFGVCALLAFLILRGRKKNKSTAEAETPNKVMYVSLNNESSPKESEAARVLEQMMGNFGVKMVNSKFVFNQLFENNDEMSLSEFKDRLRNEIYKFSHYLLITTKDLYESLERPVCSQTLNATLSRHNTDWHYYFLAEMMVKHSTASSNNQTFHFIAFNESCIRYCQKIYSFMKPLQGISRRYCLSKQSKFNYKRFRLLLNSLPTSVRNTDFQKIMKRLDTKNFLQILQPPNNLPSTPPNLAVQTIPKTFNKILNVETKPKSAQFLPGASGFGFDSHKRSNQHVFHSSEEDGAHEATALLDETQEKTLGILDDDETRTKDVYNSDVINGKDEMVFVNETASNLLILNRTECCDAYQSNNETNYQALPLCSQIQEETSVKTCKTDSFPKSVINSNTKRIDKYNRCATTHDTTLQETAVLKTEGSQSVLFPKILSNSSYVPGIKRFQGPSLNVADIHDSDREHDVWKMSKNQNDNNLIGNSKYTFYKETCL